MNARVLVAMNEDTLATDEPSGMAASVLDSLLRVRPQDSAESDRPSGLMIGELLAIIDDGATPMVTLPDAPDRALPALSLVDLHGGHIGRRVALLFEAGEGRRPVVIGVLRGQGVWSEETRPSQVELDIDGQRMVVAARERLVLRCGKASITLTKEGKVLIEGSYVSSRSTGVNRVKGGSIQLN